MTDPLPPEADSTLPPEDCPDAEQASLELFDDMSRRMRVVRVALAEVADQAKDPLRYWRPVVPKKWTEFQIRQFAKTQAWCGGFALWCFREAELAQDVEWVMGKGFLFRLHTTKDPLPGDVAYFKRTDTGKLVHHHAIVARVNVDERSVFLVNGNASGNRVATSTRPTRRADAYFSIQPLLDQVQVRP